MAWSWSRLNTVLLLAVLLVLIAMFATRAYGGPLDPPGPPGSTDGVRTPGTAISSLPITITQPGYYYVTRDLTGTTGQNGITISTSNVTIDLGGFRLVGGTSAGDGIVTTGGPRNVVVRNGSVRGWNDGVNLAGTQARVERIHAISNANVGILVGVHSEVSGCNASLNGTGVQAIASVIRNCVVSENTVRGISLETNAIVTDSLITANAGPGIEVFGSSATIRSNELSNNNAADSNYDIVIGAPAAATILRENIYCRSESTGPNTQFVDNTTRAPNC